MILTHDAGTLSGELTLEPLSQKRVPIVVHHETRLGELHCEFADNAYIFVSNDTGHIVGLVRAAEVVERLQTPCQHERTRWAQMPVAFLTSVTFPNSADFTIASIAAVTDSTLVTGNQQLLGIATETDVLLSWEKLSAVMCDAMCDPLTGLPNRLAFERRLREEWSRSCRCSNSITVIVLDVDRFKHTNDRFGHAVGDEILRRVATTLEQCLRSYDLVVRYGGDEFTAICLGCRPGEVQIPIRRIQDGLSQTSVRCGGVAVPISVSIGAAVRHGQFKSTQPEDLFAVADECLYEAKNARGSARFVELAAECHSTSQAAVDWAAESQPFPLESIDDGLETLHEIGVVG